jgi:hypothetical protein
VTPDDPAVDEAATWRVRRVDVERHRAAKAGLAMVTIGLFEWPDESGRFLEFQLALPRAEREWGYCIIDAPWTGLTGHRTVYGGLTACRLTGNELHLSINEAQETLDWPPQMVLTLDVDHAVIRRLAGRSEGCCLPA